MYMAHEIPGRLRVKLEKLRNNPYRLNEIKEMLTRTGVHEININALTGSVVIVYDPLSVTSLQLIDVLNDNGYPIDTQKEVINKKRAETHEKIVKTLGKATFSWIAGRVLDANGLSVVAAFI